MRAVHPIPDITETSRPRPSVSPLGLESSPREKGAGGRVVENAFPGGCKAQAVRRGGVHAMMDIVLISIWPLLPYCGGAVRAIDRCTGPFY